MLALIYQSNIETSADLSAEIIIRQGSHVIHETCISYKSNLRIIRVMNVAAEKHHPLNIMPLNIFVLEATPLNFTTWRGVKRKRRKIFLLMLQVHLNKLFLYGSINSSIIGNQKNAAQKEITAVVNSVGEVD